MVSKAVQAMLSKRDWRKEEGQNGASHPSGKPGERPGGSADEAGDRPIAELWPEAAFELVTLKTTGDRVLDRPLAEIGERAFLLRN